MMRALAAVVLRNSINDRINFGGTLASGVK